MMNRKWGPLPQMTTAPRELYPFKLPPNTIVLEHWQTPAFCRKMLDAGTVGNGQRERYEAIAAGRDWDRERGWRLVWLEAEE